MKLKNFLTVALLIAATFFAGFVIRQDDDPLKKIVIQLQKLTDNYPTEKVYLQLDKPYYAIGDIIYFKAYTTVGSKHQPSGLSSILYVDLINDKDSIKQSLRLPLSAGLSWGDFTLADTLHEGNYRIRAYTQYMRNYGEDYFFDKTISVGNAISNTVFTSVNYKFVTENGQEKINAVINYADLNNQPYADKPVTYNVQLDFRTVLKGKGVTDANGNVDITFSNPRPGELKAGYITTGITIENKKVVVKTVPVKATSNNVDMQFFAESGNLLNGIRSKIAFKAVGADGLGVAVKGSVLGSDNKEVAKISTQHLGMGSFLLFPENGKSYSAKIQFPDGSEKSFDLPKASDQGFVLSVNNSDPENIILHVAVGNETFKQKQNTDIMVVGQSAGEVYYTAKSKLESQTFSARIPKSRFPSGIAHFTLFTQESEPLNERVAFISNPADQLNIEVSSAASASPRQNMKLDFTVLNQAKAPVTGSFSVAVTDETKVPVNEDKETTILSNLLLTSDLKGYIEQPGYYFAHPTEKTQADLDVLMLTQGYTRFDWRLILGNSFPQLTYQPEKSMAISGTVKTLGGKPVAKAKVTLFTTSKGAFLLDTVTDANGRFKYDLVFPDSIRFVIQARGSAGKRNVEITLDNVPQQFVTKNKNEPDISINLNRELSNYLRNSKAQYDDLRKYGLVNRTIILQEVTVTEKKEPVKNSANLNGSGNADQIVNGDIFRQLGCVTIDQCLQGRLLGVIFRGGIPYSTRSFNQPMQIILDGVYVESDYLRNIPPTDVATIEVLRSGGYTSIYGGRGGGGVLVITTRRGGEDYAFQQYTPGIVTYSPRGYSRSKEFYAPKYDDPKTNKEVADLRTTIYWNPNLITGKDGKASFSFFNADSKGTYRVVIEGINDAGNLGRQVYRYKVE